MVLLTFFGRDEYGYNTIGVGAILGNGCGIKGQNYVCITLGDASLGTSIDGLTFSKASFQLCGQESFLGRGKFGFTLQF